LKPVFKIAGAAAMLMGSLLALGQLQGCVAGVVAAGGASVSMASDRRSAGTIVDDEAIELKTGKVINEDQDLGEKAHINITSYDHVVLLTGETPTAEMHGTAVAIASHTDKVLKVYDEIAVATPTSVESRSEDAWITAKIKAKLLGVKDVSSANVKVVTENRTVYLMGMVSHAEGTAAAEAARFVEGVARVVTLFEYQD
jgi:osmotically-inducible protein OsmY